MTAPVVLASRVPTDAPLDTAYSVVDAVCEGTWDYWSHMAAVWDHPGPLVNIERDMECSDDLIRELLSCPAPLCAYPYLVRPFGWPKVVYGASFGPWVLEGTDFASFSSIGFVKIAAGARRGTTLGKAPWLRLETSVHRAVAAHKRLWHLHWPAVAHRHDYGAEGDPENGTTLAMIERARAEGRLTVHGPDPTVEELRACDPLLYDESIRRRAEALSPAR